MKKLLIIIVCIFILFPLSEAFAAGSSSSYKMAVEVLDSGGAFAVSTLYKLLGKTRERQLEWLTSTNYKLGEGFIRAACFRTVFAPLVLGISPSAHDNDDVVSVTITGANFVGGATAKLSRSGQPDIIGTSVTFVSSTEITCRFDIRGVEVGYWDVTVTNPDTKYGTLASGFRVSQAELAIVGRPLNYPNPFNPDTGATSIRYVLTEDADIDIYIYNMHADRIDVMRIRAGEEGGRRGENNVLWAALAFGQKLPAGVYICQIVHKNKTLGKVKIAILR